MRTNAQQRRQRKRDYTEYMKSAEWATLRSDVFDRDNYTCRRCGESGRPGNELTAHHVTYERFRHEKLDDMLTLCKGCHQVVELQKAWGCKLTPEVRDVEFPF